MNQIVGQNPLPPDVQERVGELVDFLSTRYEIPHGQTTMFMAMCFVIAQQMGEPLK